MLWRAAATLAYVALAALTAFALVIYGAYDCYELCRYDVSNPPWAYDSSAWQWEAIFWLGVCSGIASVAFVLSSFRLGVRAAAIALAVQLALATAGAVLVQAADEAETSLVALVVASLATLGSGLIVAQRSSRTRPPTRISGADAADE